MYIFGHMSLSSSWNDFFFRTNVVEKLEVYVLCSVTFFLENRPVYEIMRKNIVERGRPQMTIWRKRISTNTHTHCFSTLTVVARTRLNITFYAYCLSCSYSACMLHARSTHLLDLIAVKFLAKNPNYENLVLFFFILLLFYLS